MFTCLVKVLSSSASPFGKSEAATRKSLYWKILKCLDSDVDFITILT
jgi:hypothetical protein